MKTEKEIWGKWRLGGLGKFKAGMGKRIERRERDWKPLDWRVEAGFSEMLLECQTGWEFMECKQKGDCCLLIRLAWITQSSAWHIGWHTRLYSQQKRDFYEVYKEKKLVSRILLELNKFFGHKRHYLVILKKALTIKKLWCLKWSMYLGKRFFCNEYGFYIMRIDS